MFHAALAHHDDAQSPEWPSRSTEGATFELGRRIAVDQNESP